MALHIVFNTIGTVVFMIIMSVMQHFVVFGADFWSMKVDSTVIAIFQSLFNVFTAIMLIPFTNLLVKVSTVLVKDEPEKPHPHPELLTLDEKLYISPSVALNEATKAVSAMGNLAKSNFRKGCDVLLKYDPEIIPEIDENETCLDSFADRSDHFLIGLSKVIESKGDDNQLDMLMQSVPSFERIGDYATNLVELSQRLNETNAEFSDSAKQELRLIFDAVNEILDITVDAFTINDNNAAKMVEPLEEVIDDMVMLLKDRHTQRLKRGDCNVDTGLIFMESLTHLERTSDHCSSIALMMLARENDEILLDHHEYLRSVHAGNDKAYKEEKNRRRQQYIEPLKNIQ